MLYSNLFIVSKKKREIDWQEINSKLPVGKSPEAEEECLKLFQKFDVNENGIISYNEVSKGIRDVLQICEIFDAKSAIHQAFTIAKNSQKSKRGSRGDEYVEIEEFKLLLLALRQYFEYWEAFVRVDENADKRISLDEFRANDCVVHAWVGEFDLDKEFSNMDLDNDGYIIFKDFCDWAILKSLDLDDDEDLIEM